MSKRRAKQQAVPQPAVTPSVLPWRDVVLALLLVVIAIAVEWPALHGEYQWDDDLHVWANPNLRDFDGLVKTWLEPRSNHQYYPLVFTIYWLERAAWGLQNVAGFHFINMLSHGINCALVWLLVRRLNIGWPWIAGLLYAVHPMIVDSVAWISELKNTISGMFFLLAALAWLKWADTPGRRQWAWYAAMTAAFLAALFSKAVVCTLPAAILLMEYWRHGKFRKRVLLGAGPLLVLGLGLAALFAWMEKVSGGARGTDFAFSLPERILIAGRSTFFYLEKFLWPADLLATYPKWKIDPAAWWQWLFPAAVIALLAALWLLRKRIGRSPFTAFAVYLVIISPALGFISFFTMRFTFVQDHYAYLAIIPLMAFVAGGLHWLAKRYRPLQTPNFGIAAGCALGILLVPLTVKQAAIWKTPRTLWEPTVAGNPNDYMSRANLAWGYFNEGRLEEAREQAEKSLALDPTFPRPRFTLGKIYLQQGRPADAVREFGAALQTEKRSPLLWSHFGIALEQVNLPLHAEAAYRRAVTYDPTQIWVWNNLASLFLRRQEWPLAEQAAREAVTRAPGYGLGHVNLGFALGKQGKFAEAAAELKIGISMVPENPRVRLELARMLLRAGDLSGAIGEYRRVIALMPNDPAPRAELDAVLEELKRGK